MFFTFQIEELSKKNGRNSVHLSNYFLLFRLGIPSKHTSTSINGTVSWRRSHFVFEWRLQGVRRCASWTWVWGKYDTFNMNWRSVCMRKND